MDYYRIVDSNEFVDRRMIMLERGWVQQRLLYGDYSWLSRDNLRFGLTLKTIEDFLGSKGYRSDLFAKQLDEMLDAYDVVIFMREGQIRFDPATGIVLNTDGDHNIRDIRNWLHRWQVKGIIIETTPSLKDTADRVCELYALWQKPWSMSAKSRAWADERVLSFPSSTRGKTAMAVLERFGSLTGVATAGINQLKGVEGVGSKKAQAIFDHFHHNGKTEPTKPVVDNKPLFEE